MSNLNGYIGCMPWGQQQHPAVQRNCAMCERAIALAANNVERARGFVLCCVNCLLELFPDAAARAGGIVGGKIYQDQREAILAALAEKNRN